MAEGQKCHALPECSKQGWKAAHNFRGHVLCEASPNYCATHPIQMDTYMALSITCRKAGGGCNGEKG